MRTTARLVLALFALTAAVAAVRTVGPPPTVLPLAVSAGCGHPGLCCDDCAADNPLLNPPSPLLGAWRAVRAAVVGLLSGRLP